MTEVLKDAFQGLAEALRSGHSGHSQSSTSTTARIKTAPTFEGEAKEYYLFKQSLKSFLRRHGIDQDDVLAVDVSINCCKGLARRFVGSLPI